MGSEMCIRDRPWACRVSRFFPRATIPAVGTREAKAIAFFVRRSNAKAAAWSSASKGRWNASNAFLPSKFSMRAAKSWRLVLSQRNSRQVEAKRLIALGIIGRNGAGQINANENLGPLNS